MPKVIAKTDEIFCIYCQVIYRTPNFLARHIYNKHKETDVYYNLIEVISDPVKENENQFDLVDTEEI